MEFSHNFFFCEIDLFDFTSFFGLDFFKYSGQLCFESWVTFCYFADLSVISLRIMDCPASFLETRQKWSVWSDLTRVSIKSSSWVITISWKLFAGLLVTKLVNASAKELMFSWSKLVVGSSNLKKKIQNYITLQFTLHSAQNF